MDDKMMETESTQDRLGTVYAVPLMLFFVAVLLFIGLLQRQQELTVVCLVTIGVVGGAFVWSRASLRATEFNLGVEPARLFPDEHLQISLEVINAKALPIHLTVGAGMSGALAVSQDSQPGSQSSGLLGYQRATFRWTLAPGPRGVHTVGPLRVTSGDPFGFFPRQSRIPARREIVVYPRLVPLRAVAFPRREAFGEHGAHSHISDPVHILGTRDYQPSAPARHIHWKASARHSRLQSKVFASSQQEKSMLLLDVAGLTRHPDAADFEKILEVIASLAVEKDRQGCATGFLTNAAISGPARAILPPARDPHQIVLILEALARCAATATGDLLNVLRSSASLPWGTSCALFTFKRDRQTQLLQAFLSRRRTPLKIITAEQALALRNQDARMPAGITHI